MLIVERFSIILMILISFRLVYKIKFQVEKILADFVCMEMEEENDKLTS